MLKPTVKKDCCWHNVSRHAAQASVRQDGKNVSAAPHTDGNLSNSGFGEAYYERLSQLIDKHLELATDDCVCYVGDTNGALVVPVISQQYFIVAPVTQVNPYIV